MAGESGVGDERGADLQLAGFAVRDDGDRRHIGNAVGGEDIGDLLHTVAAGVEHESLLAGRKAGKQTLEVRNAGIDEDDL